MVFVFLIFLKSIYYYFDIRFWLSNYSNSFHAVVLKKVFIVTQLLILVKTFFSLDALIFESSVKLIASVELSFIKSNNYDAHVGRNFLIFQ